jgi:di/tripeptidase
MSSETVLSGLEARACWRHLEALTVSLDPQIEAPLSPDERVSIPTVARFWRLLAGVVDELSSVEPQVAAKHA